jgi:DNA polymerase III subunit epsilon-like, C-terminal domain
MFNSPDTFQFGDSQVIPKVKLGEIVQATISSLASPDSETLPNQLILVVHGVGSDLERLADLKVSKYAFCFVVAFFHL